MDKKEAIELVKNKGFEKSLFEVKYEGIISKEDFFIEDNEIFNHKCFIVSGVGGNGIHFVVDSNTKKVYESYGKPNSANGDMRRELKLLNEKENKDTVKKGAKNRQINAYDCGSDFTCPDCGEGPEQGKYDAGNGFCQEFADEH